MYFLPPLSGVGPQCHLYRFVKWATATGQRWRKDTILTSRSSWWGLAVGRLSLLNKGLWSEQNTSGSLPPKWWEDIASAKFLLEGLGQINYSHFRDQNITLGVLKIFCKCWPYLSTLCSLAPEINGRHNSQKTGISFPSCSISLPWEHNGLFCDWKVHFYFLPSFLPGLKLLQVPSI